MKLPLILLPVALLAACGATDPSRDQGDVRDFNQAIAYFGDADVTPTNRLPTTSPTGFVRYEGEIGSDIRVNGERGYAFVGDLTMDVGFAGSRDVDGSVRNIDLIHNGTPDQQLRGSLDVFGQQASGKIDAVAEGVVTRTTDANFDERTNLFLDLNGNVRSAVSDGDAIFGVVNADRSFGDGTGTGVPPLRTFNVVLDGDGAFYAER